MRKKLSLLGFAVASAIGLAGCTVQNLPNGGVAFNPVPMNQILGNGATSSGSFPSIGQSANYSGPMDGGPGQMTLSNLGGGSYHVSLSVASNAGMGAVSGTAYLHSDGSIWMDRGDVGNGRTAPCVISFTPKGGAVSVFERNCMFFHGAAVSFDGTLYRH